MRLKGLAAAAALVGALAMATPALAAPGSISGTVTDASTHLGVPGIWVCAQGVLFGPHGECAGTDGNGAYTISGLEPGFYSLVFEEEGRQNYLAQWYPGKPTRGEGSGVQLESGQALSGFDAQLASGGEFEGMVTDVATGHPVEGVEVCAEPAAGFPDEPSVMHCDKSDARAATWCRRFRATATGCGSRSTGRRTTSPSSFPASPTRPKRNRSPSPPAPRRCPASTRRCRKASRSPAT
jgi:hypothetical protein